VFANKRTERIGINRDFTGTEQKNQKKVILSERGSRGKQFENVKKSGVESRVSLKDRPEKNLKNNAKRNETGAKVSRQAAMQKNFRVKNRANTPRNNKIIARKNNKQARRQVHNQVQQNSSKTQKIKGRSRGTSKELPKKFSENNWHHGAKRDNPREKKQQYSSQQNSSWERNNKRQRPERIDISASLKKSS
jgi:hypothetical protein